MEAIRSERHTFLALCFDLFRYPFSRTPSKGHQSGVLLWPIDVLVFRMTAGGQRALDMIGEFEVTRGGTIFWVDGGVSWYEIALSS